jgi:putative drug exporter of the RND superfamily
MRRLARIVAGRRTKWLVLVTWVLVLAALAPLGGKLADETVDDTESFLPASAESTEVVRLLDHRFESGETSNGLLVYQRAGGLTRADLATARRDAREVARAIPVTERPSGPVVSRSGDVALVTISVPQNYDKLADWGKEVKQLVGEGHDGLRLYLTGDLGFNTDAEEIFGSIDTRLLLATTLLVLFLLGAIYRSPVIAVVPLIVVGVSYGAAQGLIYLYAKSGAEVSSNATSILVVLMFGVGTDYCLLLVSRYREELRRCEDKHAAMARAVRRAGPAILASGLTVSLAMLVLLVAETGSVHSLGPVSAIGVTVAFCAGLTLLPAILTITGRRGFWPRRATVEYDAEADAHPPHPGVWRRVGDRVLQRPGPALGVTLAIFGVGSLGILAYKENYSVTGFFKKQTDSVDGFKVMERAFPAGTSQPMTVLVERESGTATQGDVQRVRSRLAGAPGVASVTPVQDRSRDGRITELSVILRSDPYASEALDTVPKLRERLDALPRGLRALVGGGTAIQYDYDASTTRDLRLIVPIALAVIALILGVLLQAVVAPLVLIASVVASFFGTLGISLLFIRYVVGDPGVDNSLPTFAFIFLVALGIDYTIFLMSRVREEARRHGTREGMLRALAATGPVITSAGIILAGTFSVLMTLPVTFTFNLGFMVALGILLDTFVVRTIMVPAAVELIGDKIWWPSSPGGGAHAIGEAPRAEEPAPAPAPAS